MATVNGDVVTRVGDTDPIDIALLQDDGTTAINLTSIASLTINFQEYNTLSTFSLGSGTVSVSSATGGAVQITHTASTFLFVTRYQYYASFYDTDSKVITVPKNKNYNWTIIGKF